MKKNNVITSLLAIGLCVFYTLCVRFYDYRAIGPLNSKVGFATLNERFKDYIGVHMTLYKVTNILGIFLGLIALAFVIIGVIQLVKRKKIFKVDKEIILMGCFYVVVIAVFFLFEKLKINYRPILDHGDLEASFPSTHVFITLCIGVSAMLITNKYFKPYRLINILIGLLMAAIIILRVISGVHWFTDIIGGIFIGGTLLYIFYSFLLVIKKKH